MSVAGGGKNGGNVFGGGLQTGNRKLSPIMTFASGAANSKTASNRCN